MPLHLKIITPLRIVLETDVRSLLLPSTEGQIEILPGHTALITSVDNGELLCDSVSDGTVSFFISGGFLQVEDDTALVVTDTALEAAEMDPASINAAIEQARNNLRNSGSVLSREEQLRLEASITKQMSMLEYRARRRKKH